MYAGLPKEDAEIVIELSRELTGMMVDINRHSVIVHNVASRLRSLGHRNLASYLAFVEQSEPEFQNLISCLTIHTTSWFREPGAFEVFTQVVAAHAMRCGELGTFKFLSVGCSTGEEVYSFGAYLESQRVSNPSFEYSIEGWDIDPISLKTGRKGDYSRKQIESLSEVRRNLVLLKSGAAEPGFFKVPENLLVRSRFRAVNALDMGPVQDKYHFISCRNMLIYFNSDQTKKIVESLVARLMDAGHFCTGVSEVSVVPQELFQARGSAVFEYLSKKSKTNVQRVDRIERIEKTPTAVTSQPKKSADSRRILLVDDEPELVELMKEELEGAKHLVEVAYGPKEAVEKVKKTSFGLIVSDYTMPGMNGFDFSRQARALGHQGAFVVLTGHAQSEMTKTGLQAGVNEVIAKPISKRELLKLADIYLPQAVVEASLTHSLAAASAVSSGNRASTVGSKPFQAEVLAFGASTGGTELLVSLLANLPKPCPPVLVVQHIAAEFAEQFAKRLAQASGLKLAQMKDGEILASGTLYIALGDCHFGVRRSGGNLCMQLSQEAKVSGHRPSVDFLFSSLAKARVKCFAALLTGMGRDGATGLSMLKVQNSLTIAQNQASSVVFGMPKEAIELRAACYVLNPQQIRQKMIEVLQAS